MGEFVRYVKSLFKIYETGYEYWIPLKDIIIQDKMKNSMIKPNKWKLKLLFYRTHGYCQSKILLNKNFILIDGYSSYKIYSSYCEPDKLVPVWFVNVE